MWGVSFSTDIKSAVRRTLWDWSAYEDDAIDRNFKT